MEIGTNLAGTDGKFLEPCSDVLSLLQSKMNFTFKIIKKKPSGYEQENGTWTGKIGEFCIKPLDIATSFLFCVIVILDFK